MSPKAPKIGLHNVYLTPGRKPRVLKPGYAYHFGVSDKQQIVFRANGREYNTFKNPQGRHIIWSSKIGIPMGVGRIRPAKLDEGRNVIEGIEIKKSGAAFVARLMKKEVKQLPPSQPIEPPEAVRARVETIIDPAAVKKAAAREMQESKYYRVQNAVELKHKDVFPGHTFDRELQDYEQWRRELPYINDAPESASYELIRKGIDLVKTHPGDVWSKAQAVADLFDSEYSPLQNPGVQDGRLVSQGFFLTKGGCCRHRASLLAYILQQGGIEARYIRRQVETTNKRGGVVLGWHAWVEIDITGEGKYEEVNVIDPNMQLRGRRKVITFGPGKSVVYQVIRESGQIALMSNGRPRGYHVDYAEFNAVWRRGVQEKSRDELLTSFEKGMVVEKRLDAASGSYTYILKPRTKAMFETVVAEEAYNQYQRWLNSKVDIVIPELDRQINVMLPMFDAGGSMWFAVDIKGGKVKPLTSTGKGDANVEVRVKHDSGKYIIGEVRVHRNINEVERFVEMIRERFGQVEIILLD